MWTYEKKLQYPVNIKNPNPAYAKIIMDQYGGLCGKKILHIHRKDLTNVVLYEITLFKSL